MEIKRIVKERSVVIPFGKVGYPTSKHRKCCAIEVKMSLTTYSDGSVAFSCMGDIWNHLHTDIWSGGQNQDFIRSLLDSGELIELPNSREILDLWDKYHLNNLRAGTIQQHEAIQKAYDEGLIQQDCDFYAQACDYLKSVGLYEVEHNGEPYRFGHGWLYHPIPQEDLARIQEIMGITL